MTQNRISKLAPAGQINNHQTIFICGNLTLTLPSPEFQNHEKLQYTRINRRTRGGDLMVFRASYWPKSKTFSMQWSTLTANQRESLRMFLLLTLGKKMTLVDHEGRSYVVIITTPEGDIREDRRGANSVTLDFETEN